jgi:hypothetical protein
VPLTPISEATGSVVRLLQGRVPFGPGRGEAISQAAVTVPAPLDQIAADGLAALERWLPQWAPAGAALPVLLAARLPGLPGGLYRGLVRPGGELAWELASGCGAAAEPQRDAPGPQAAFQVCADLRLAVQPAGGTHYGSLLVLAGALAEAICEQATRRGLTARINTAPDLQAVQAARQVRRTYRHLVTAEIKEIEPSE